MVIFHSYVSLPEGIHRALPCGPPWSTMVHKGLEWMDSLFCELRGWKPCKARGQGQIQKGFSVKHSETNRKAMTFQYFSRTKFQTRNFSDNVRPHDSLLDSVANLSQTLLPLRFLGQELEPTSTDCCRCSHNWVVLNMLKWVIQWPLQTSADKRKSFQNGYGSIPIHTIFRGMNIHLPAILMFTRGLGFDPSPNKLWYSATPWTKI